VKLGQDVGYAAPIVTLIEPRVLLLGGGPVVITGTNFGASACSVAGSSYVTFTVTQSPSRAVDLQFNASSGLWASPSENSGLAAVNATCNVTSWWDGAIECVAPPGLDANVSILVTAGARVHRAMGLVGYASPAVLSVAAPVGQMGTPGGWRVVVSGSGFPLPPCPLAVTVGGRACAVDEVSRSAGSVACVVPSGWGRQQVVVRSPTQASVEVVTVQYDGPEVAPFVTPSLSERPIEGRFRIFVTGKVGASVSACKCVCHNVRARVCCHCQYVICCCLLPGLVGDQY
jgi:hypothetical protein